MFGVEKIRLPEKQYAQAMIVIFRLTFIFCRIRINRTAMPPNPNW